MSVCILALLAPIGARLARGGRVKTSRGLEESKRRRVIFRGEGGGDPETSCFGRRNEAWTGMVQRTRTTGSDRPSGSDRWPEEF